MDIKMTKIVTYLTLCSLAQAAYISRMAMSRLRAPTAFRPGVTLHRPWMQGPRIMAAASHRAPYYYYRNAPPKYRYSMKPMTRNVYPGGLWKTTPRLPAPAPLSVVTPEYEFLRAAAAPPNLHAEAASGAIHTIPAPNLSLSEKPIVVIDSAEHNPQISYGTSEAPKQAYEVTERYPDQSVLPLPAKIEQPIGFSKASSLTTPELQSLVRNGATFQIASELGLPPHQHIMPHQFSLQSFHNLPPQQDLLNSGAEIIIPPTALYQQDPGYLQKLQHQFMNRYPAVEFIPYPADPSQIHLQHQLQAQQSQQFQNQQSQQIQAQQSQQIHIQAAPPQHQLFLLENEQFFKQPPSSFVPYEAQKNVVQRETQESSVVTLVPVANNATSEAPVSSTSANDIDSSTAATEPHDITLELLTPVTDQSTTTTVKYIFETSTEDQKEQKTTPIYYAQIGQSVGNLVAKGFYSAINDVKAAAALAQVEKPEEQNAESPMKPNEQTTTTSTSTTSTTTTVNPDIKAYFIQTAENKNDSNVTVTELKPLLGVPFAKSADSVKVAYTLLRADDKESKINKDGEVYAGQIVEATISEDKDFNNEKANLLSKRAPIRLFAVTDKKDIEAATIASVTPKITVVKAKIPPKSKLTFDDKTGEPVLRIYASYVDSPLQKEFITTKLSNIKHVKEAAAVKKQEAENWKSATLKAVDKTHGTDANQVASFGLKLRSRSDDYVPIFDNY